MILALALFSSVSALLLPTTKVPRARGVYSAPHVSSALLSTRSRPLLMSFDLSIDTQALVLAAASVGFIAGFKIPKEEEEPSIMPESGPKPEPTLVYPNPEEGPGTPETRAADAAKNIPGVNGPLLQALATFCAMIENREFPTESGAVVGPIPLAKYTPADGIPPNKDLDQPYKVTIGGGGALDIFNSSLMSWGTVIDGIVDFHDEFEVSVPPFAAIVVQPKDEQEVYQPLPDRALIEAPLLPRPLRYRLSF